MSKKIKELEERISDLERKFNFYCFEKQDAAGTWGDYVPINEVLEMIIKCLKLQYKKIPSEKYFEKGE